MYTNNSPIYSGHKIIRYYDGNATIDFKSLLYHIQNNKLNLLIIAGMLYLLFSKQFQLSVAMNKENVTPLMIANIGIPSESTKILSDIKTIVVKKNTGGEDAIVEILPARPMSAVKSVVANGEATNEANIFNNVSIFMAPEKANPAMMKTKKEKCWDYVRRFVGVAKAEREKFGIPVSITLAQGLLESDAGESRLTQIANNHFGVKTFNRKVPHVVMKDDTPKDKFRKYNSAWESFRDHSQLLMNNHYKDLQYLSKTDYAGWAKGLQNAGYATDVQYAQKLIRLIENLQLYKLDEVG